MLLTGTTRTLHLARLAQAGLQGLRVGEFQMRTASKLVIAEPDSEVFIATNDCSRSHLQLLRDAGLIGLQLVGLWGFNVAGTLAAKAFALPIPGNLAGMV